jgi:hypothetical protein
MMTFYLNECANGKTRLLTYGDDNPQRGYAIAVQFDSTPEQVVDACNKLIAESLKTPIHEE